MLALVDPPCNGRPPCNRHVTDDASLVQATAQADSRGKMIELLEAELGGGEASEEAKAEAKASVAATMVLRNMHFDVETQTESSGDAVEAVDGPAPVVAAG